MILLDTHAAIWLATDHGLRKQSQRLIDKAIAEGSLAISAMSFWERAMLVVKRRLRALNRPAEQRSKMLAAGIRELPLTGEIAILAAELENLHGDPVDRIIAATSITHDATLITADANLLRWRYRLKRQDAEQ